MKEHYSREIVLLCPVCGNSQFETISDDVFMCIDCKSEIDRDSLVEHNSSLFSATAEDVQKESITDFVKDLKKVIKGIK